MHACIHTPIYIYIYIYVPGYRWSTEALWKCKAQAAATEAERLSADRIGLGVQGLIRHSQGLGDLRKTWDKNATSCDSFKEMDSGLLQHYSRCFEWRNMKHESLHRSIGHFTHLYLYLHVPQNLHAYICIYVLLVPFYPGASLSSFSTSSLSSFAAVFSS